MKVTGDLRSVRYRIAVNADALAPDAEEPLFGATFGIELFQETGPLVNLPHQSVELVDKLCFVRLPFLSA